MKDNFPRDYEKGELRKTTAASVAEENREHASWRRNPGKQTHIYMRNSRAIRKHWQQAH